MLPDLTEQAISFIVERVELEILFVDLLFKRLESSDYTLHNQFRFEYKEPDGTKCLLGTDILASRAILEQDILSLGEELNFEKKSLNQHLTVNENHPILESLQERIINKQSALELLNRRRFVEPNIVTWYRIKNYQDAHCFINNYEGVLEIEGIFWWGIEMGLDELPTMRLRRLESSLSSN